MTFHLEFKSQKVNLLQNITILTATDSSILNQ